MNGLALPVLALIVAVLIAVGPVVSVMRPKFAGWGSFAMCAIGAVAVMAYLIAGAPPQLLSVPFGLAGQPSVLALDGVSGLFLLVLMMAGTAASAASLDDQGHPLPTAPAFPVFLGGMALTLLAGDAFALVAGFELMSLASFTLVVTNHRDAGVRAAGLLYLGMAGFAALCLIAALALLAAHGMSFAAIRAHPPEGLRAMAVLALVVVGVGSKAGLVPLHIWLPPAHAAAPGHASAMMSGAMTKVALYVIIRLVFDLSGPAQPIWWSLPLLAMGLASAILGALRANIETDVKSILACSTVENVGLITIGLGLAMAARAADLSVLASLALGAALLHICAHAIFKTLLFLSAGAIQHGTGTRMLARLGGLVQRMPITASAMLLGAACLAGLPPSAGFASEWMLFQSVLGAVRLGGIGPQILVCVLAAGLALATALAASAAVRLVGVALLGRPRSQLAATAHEAGPPVRWALLLLALVIVMIGLFPAAVLGLADPALRILTNTSLNTHVGVLTVSPAIRFPGYVPLGVAALLALAAIGIAAVLRARAVAGHRAGPAWDCGFGASPTWLPFGDPLTQYSGGGFAQPLRRVLGGPLLSATTTLDMPQPGDTRPAVYTETAQDPSELYIFAPLANVRATVSGLADRMQFLTVRQILTVMVTALVVFMALVALMEQL